jgi:hypothetical protein
VVISHGFRALLGGFAVMAAVAAAARLVLSRARPGWAGETARRAPGSLFADAVVAMVAGGSGGFVTAWAAPVNPLGPLVGLSIASLALAALSALFEREHLSMVYLFAVLAFTPLAVIAGGLLRLRLWGWHL